MKGDHPLIHQPRKSPSSSLHPGRIYDHAWCVKFLDRFGRVIFALDPYVLHGPDKSDNGYAEIVKMAADTRAKNPTAPIWSVKISYLGIL